MNKKIHQSISFLIKEIKKLNKKQELNKISKEEKITLKKLSSFFEKEKK